MRAVSLYVLILVVLAASCPAVVSAAVRQVGVTRAYATVQAAHDAASDGDVIEIDSGTYVGGFGWCLVNKSNLTFRGVGPTRPIIDGNGGAVASKGIFVLNTGSSNTTIENLELCNARLSPEEGRNGAGVRGLGIGFTIRNCYIHDCDNGVLSDTGGSQVIEYSEFYHNGYGDGQSHNMYIGACDSFTLRYCYSHDAVVGHQVKTRARKNYIWYNLISDDDGTGSYEINVPQAGTTYIIGNSIYQGGTGNSGIISYAEEGSINSDRHLYVVNNTIVNARTSGTFVVNRSSTKALIQNNILQGDGTIPSGTAFTALNNWSIADASLLNPAVYDYHLTAASAGAIDMGGVPSPATGIGGASLIPTLQYKHPCSYETRPAGSQIDIGAFEVGTGNQWPTVSAGPDQLLVVPSNTAALVGTAGDDGLPGALTCTWSLSNGPAGGSVTFGNRNALSTTAAFSTPGVYVLQLLVSDGLLTNTDTVTVVYDQPPVVQVSPDQTIVTSQLPVDAFPTGQVIDSDHQPASFPFFTWSVLSGPAPATIAYGSYYCPMFTFSAPGTYVVQLLGSDGALSSTATTTITVILKENAAPVVDAGPDQAITLPGSASLSGSVSDDGLPDPLRPVTCLWSALAGPGTVSFADSTSAVTTATFSVAGIYTLQLEASDGQLCSVDTVTVAVNATPTVQVGAPVSVAYEGSEVSLHASGSDSDAQPMTFQWTQTAGQIVEMVGAATADVSFRVPPLASRASGSMTFRVTVRTDSGGLASCDVTVQACMAGDANQDWFVNVGDLQLLVAAWGSSMAVGGSYDARVDFNGDGNINVGDLQILTANWSRVLN